MTPDARRDTAPDDGTPTVVGPYRLHEPLGHGAFATVHRATSDAPRREVALKLLDRALGAAARERFAREVDVLARLSGPGLAVLHEAGVTDDGRPWFAMERVRGRHLLAWAAEDRAPARVLPLFVDLCDAVDRAHRLGVVHRDLKDGNILVTDDDRPKVLDFGSARGLGTDPADERLTRDTDIVGSLGGLAPEQAAGDAGDARADVWALGALLHEALVGWPPHDLRGLGVAEVLERKRVPVPRLSRRAPALRGDTEWVVARALAVEPRDRYATAGDLRDDLVRLLHDEEVEARADDLPRAAARWVRTHRGLSAGLAVVLVALAAGTAALRAASEHTHRVEARARRQASEIGQLSDRLLLDDLRSEAAALLPLRPALRPALEAWLARARVVARRLRPHRETCRRWEAELAATVDSMDDERAADWRRTIARGRALVDDLEAFAVGPWRRNGVREVARRLEVLERLERESLVDAADAWRAARASVADPDECPAYRGLDLPPQFGLVPLGRDRASGLWEFAFLPSGPAPRRDADGELHPAAGDAIVLVLVPGGDAWLGAQLDDPSAPFHESRPDTSVVALHEVSLEPFFIAKHEVTQAQWGRLTGEHPSYFYGGWEMPPARATFSSPVDSLSWHAADAGVRRVGLALPTYDQWEYAARAGVTTRFLTGVSSFDLACANHHDASAVALDGNRTRFDPRTLVDDGFAIPAPVGSYPPNAFGLHDVLGNVNEFVRAAEHPGEGFLGELPSGPSLAGIGAFRGGSYFDDARRLRLGVSSVQPPDTSAATHGVRPALAIARSGGARVAVATPDR